MPEFRVAHGSRISGPRPLRQCHRLVLTAACAAVLVALAAAGHARAGGGAPLGGAPSPAHHNHRPSPPRQHSHPRGVAGNPLAGRAMWIWELPDAAGGNVTDIIADAHRYGVGTLLIKSGDGGTMWPQFTSQLVQALHAGGLRVCAWQYVYGNNPISEAYVGAAAVHDGADCLVIDAESEYEGKYVAAQSYLRRLRQLIGYRFPLVLAGFPYVDYHPAYPYSVFLGPGGAQYNAPQMYWRDIGTSTDAVFAHTYAYNLIYGRTIDPLGQLYSDPPGHQIMRFRELARVYGAPGVSWWDWQSASPAQWIAMSRPAGNLPGYVPYTTMASIGPQAVGDVVVWAQEHLISAGYAIGVDGDFGNTTEQAVLAFQLAHGLTADGIIGPETWTALLRYRTARIRWVHRGRLQLATAATARGRQLVAPVPASASRPARRDEIPGSTGAGRP
jgi:hypothetical protein